MDILYGSAGKESSCNVGNLGLIPGLGRSLGEDHGYPLQCSGRENSIECTVHGVAKNWTRLIDFHFHYAICRVKQSQTRPTKNKNNMDTGVYI